MWALHTCPDQQVCDRARRLSQCRQMHDLGRRDAFRAIGGILTTIGNGDDISEEGFLNLRAAKGAFVSSCTP